MAEKNDHNSSVNEVPAKETLCQVKIPPGSVQYCSMCGGKIFGLKAVLDNGKFYHECCMVCNNCIQPLNTEYRTVGNGRYCSLCYSDMYLPLCAKCDLPVKQEEGVLIYGCLQHSSCIQCEICKEIIPNSFYNKNDMYFCRECYQNTGNNKTDDEDSFDPENL
ncbi:Four and a half LIM domains protein 3 [Trichinella pseudospiralis]|uniref:Four and a half LIM domains protein 3 n=1 Tax=Trichinella pseudospiralis TaxID=6337 RepID=A0A0V1KGR3_TRIPS|nr:Four and a half LIM domains protein 3 [Trichinella pseudospiralis]KRZ34688.1 Four and a half LIM domains protein 3 [Trichinella pseudospiralis]KRZ46388.1 Four and a half LIM domains protein 3 [Trichinella pseudospiralis]